MERAELSSEAGIIETEVKKGLHSASEVIATNKKEGLALMKAVGVDDFRTLANSLRTISNSVRVIRGTLATHCNNEMF